MAIWWNSGDLEFNKTIIATDFPGTKVLLDDMDGDGDEDIVGASATTGNIYWWEYTCLSSQDCTNENIVLNESPIAPAIYAGYPIIESSGTVVLGTTVSLVAGESVTLNAGFHAQVGSNFDASIAICKATTSAFTQTELLYKTTDVGTNTSNPKLAIYPNPSTNKLTITYTLEKDQAAQLYLTDIIGRPVKYLRAKTPTFVGQHQEQFLLADLQAGIYFIILQTGDEYVSRKIVVE